VAENFVGKPVPRMDARQIADMTAETQAAPANDGTDIVVSDATQLAELAWSRDEPEPQSHRHRWVTAWFIAAVFLVCGVVMSTAIWAVSQHHPAPPTVAPTMTPVPSSAPPVTAQTVPRVSHAIEENFVAALGAAPDGCVERMVTTCIPWVMIPGGSPDTRNDDRLLLTHGYEACAVMARYPGNRHDAAYAFYREQGFNMESIASFPSFQQSMLVYMDLVNRYLCQHN
jgi:hypothetical protein